MKPLHISEPERSVASLDGRPSQKPGCTNQGKKRSQERKRTSRQLFLWDDCFVRLPLYELKDLFVRFRAESRDCGRFLQFSPFPRRGESARIRTSRVTKIVRAGYQGEEPNLRMRPASRAVSA
jgi:hypothetical protein